jgi:hypothetical protein
MPRVTVNLPEALRKCCEKDAGEMHISLSMYFRRLAEQRLGLTRIVKQSVPAPRGGSIDDMWRTPVKDTAGKTVYFNQQLEPISEMTWRELMSLERN